VSWRRPGLWFEIALGREQHPGNEGQLTRAASDQRWFLTVPHL
jgi:hypothetical protein